MNDLIIVPDRGSWSVPLEGAPPPAGSRSQSFNLVISPGRFDALVADAPTRPGLACVIPECQTSGEIWEEGRWGEHGSRRGRTSMLPGRLGGGRTRGGGNGYRFAHPAWWRPSACVRPPSYSRCCASADQHAPHCAC